MAAGLATYNRMRDFRATLEPKGRRGTAAKSGRRFVIQKHAARSLHYDFRLEWEGVLRSWAVPKGPSLDPAVKRMAVQVEDHPLSYGDFEGTIPRGHYGAGSVILWDRGTWQPVGDARKGLRDGRLKFTLKGSKLSGGFTLVRMRDSRGSKAAWLLIKERDAHARASADFDVLEQQGESVAPTPARRRALPALVAPQLATLVSAPPADGEWLYEAKLDGYRILARIDRRQVRCFTRNGHDWSRRLPATVAALRALDLPPCWLDGEIVVLDKRGAPDFQQLQNAFEQQRTADVRYVAFDLLFCDGKDLRQQPLRHRREQLQQLLGEGHQGVQFSPTLDGDPAQLLLAARRAGLEGLVGKRADAPYHSGRNRDWIKLKAGLRQEFVIGGYTDPHGARTGFGSLLLGVHDAQGKLRYAGNVGSGFDEAALRALRKSMDRLRATTSAFAQAPQRVGPARMKPHWVKPQLVAEVSFAGWTADAHVRQGVFRGLRDDKPAAQIVREEPQRVTKARARHKPSPVVRGMTITHPGRVIDAREGGTKGDLVAYYARVSKLLLPHLARRPVALLRAPQGVSGNKFFQKHADAKSLPHVERLPRALDPGHAPLLGIPSRQALLSAAQMNVVELHTWNATTAAIEKPDRLVFDLDPGEGVTWQAVRESAQLLHAVLEELQLKSFLKTSGGKGLHVVVPLKPLLAWQPVKAFTRQLVEHLARVVPQRFVAKSGPRNRVGRVFVDYLRNGRGATTVAAWSARARPGLPISVPLAWSELAEMDQPPAWTILDCEQRLNIGNQPWKMYARSRQTLDNAMRKLSSLSGTRSR